MKKVISTDQAPEAIGPYSQGVWAGPFLYLSGQIPLDPETGEVEAGDAALQTERVMRNLGGVLRGAGLKWRHVVKTTLYLADMADFSAVNEIYANFLKPPFPARATVQVASLPKGAKVEIEAVAYKT